MERKLGDRSQTFLNEVYEEGYDPAAPRRKAAASKPKEPKAEKVQLEDLDMEQQAELLIRCCCYQIVNKCIVEIGHGLLVIGCLLHTAGSSII